MYQLALFLGGKDSALNARLLAYVVNSISRLVDGLHFSTVLSFVPLLVLLS